MNKISNLFSRYIGRVFFTLLLCLMSGSAWADDNCPTLPQKTLELCNPTKDEVAEALTTPIALINGVRTEGYPSSDNDEFFESIKDQVYTLKWNFKDAGGNTIASGCPQNFKLTDSEAPTCGASQITAYGDGLYIEKQVLISEIKNQANSWSDNCSVSEEITFQFDESKMSRQWDGASITVPYTLTDIYGNQKECSQKVKVEAKLKSYPCPAIKAFTDNVECYITQTQLLADIKSHFFDNLPKMDGFGGNISPNNKDGKVYIYRGNDDRTLMNDGSNIYTPGDNTFYLKYHISLWNEDKFCPFKVVVKDNSAPPKCPNFGDLVFEDKTSISAKDISSLLQAKVSSYSAQLDNCETTDNSMLSVKYSGGDINSSCQEVSYILSNYGAQRTCHANIVLLNCPNLPSRTKTFCTNNNSSLSKDELIAFLNIGKPQLQYCDKTIQGTLVTDGLSDSYNRNQTITQKWNFYNEANELIKTCSSNNVSLKVDNNETCTAQDFVLEAEKDCEASGSKIVVPVLNGCYNKYWRSDEWCKDKSSWTGANSLTSSYLKNGDIIYWRINSYGYAYCQSKITVVDNTAPTCLSPSLGTLPSRCEDYLTTDVQTKFDVIDLAQKGSDNCGIESAEIDWAYTAYTSFSPAADGGDKSYTIYYKLKDVSGFESDYCEASITVKGYSDIACPETTMGFLTDNSSVSLALDNQVDWTISPSTYKYESGTLSNLSQGDNAITFTATKCGKTLKTCSSTIKLYKPATPCTTE